MEHYFVIYYIPDGQILSYASNYNKCIETYDIDHPIPTTNADFNSVCNMVHSAWLLLSFGNVIIADYDGETSPLIGPIKFSTYASAQRFLHSALKIKAPWVRTEGLSKNHFVILEIQCQK